MTITSVSDPDVVAHTHDDLTGDLHCLIPFVKIPNAAQQPVARRQYGFQLQDPLHFIAPNGRPFRLATAYEERGLQGLLLNHNHHVLETAGTKYTILIHIEGQQKFTKQKYAHLRNGLRTLGGVAKQIAEVVEEYIDHTRHNVPSQTDDTWRLGPGYIDFNDLYLLELRHVAKASYQVILGCNANAVTTGNQGHNA
ncbi:hypothetical protein BC629DRAFT_1588220 [Irpex lacteus]|nr:hypothetical protein BC629DRAFT_1588220 [Irpex lacteus]